MRIAIIGAGYVGLVTGACLARFGHEVHVWESDISKVRELQAGRVPIYEPGLEDLIKSHEIYFHHSSDRPNSDFEAFYIAVGTPQKEDGDADLSYVTAAAEWIRDELGNAYAPLVVIKSTVPPGTADMVREILGELPAVVVSNPEFLKEGNAIQDFCNPDRIVIGFCHHDEPVCWQTVMRFRRDIYDGRVGDDKFLAMSNRSAELAKYASNAMLATRISFMNEMSRICDFVDADIDDIKTAVGSDSRIGPAFLNAGPGWGGSCFPKDLSALSSIDHGIAPLVSAAIRTNEMQKSWIATRAAHVAKTFLSDASDSTSPAVCVWGVAFKPHTDDIRESPALDIIRALEILGCDVICHDPIAKLPREMGVVQYDCKYDAAMGADLVLVLTEWPEYKATDWERISKWDSPPIVFDARNCLDRNKVEKYLRLHRL